MKRADQLKAISHTEKWDIVIIGGGATGLGAALDAASRGFKTLCIEKTDFSKGTSSRSTKLIHGGVRYLEQGNFSMVRSALMERWFLLKNAPFTTKKIPFILPVYSWWRYIYYGFGLMLYDLLSGKFSIGKTKFLKKETVIAKIPQIRQQSLKGGIQYYDGQFDDSQICISLARTAISKGATVINHMSAENFLYEGSNISGIQLRDTLYNKIYEVRSKTVINATGVFADDLILKDNPAHHRIVTPSQGIHLVVDKQYHNSPYAMLIPKTTDGRILFAVPWHDKVVIGTTDTTAPDISEEPQATNEEIHFVLDNFNRYINTQLTSSDIKSVFTGLRPLVKMKNIQSTADLVRDHSIVVSASGLVTITGGKWTTYRKMARDVINKAIRAGNLPFRRCKTRSIKLLLGRKVAGKKAPELLHSNYPFTIDDVIYAIHHEMACTLEDILARRIRLLFLDVKAAIEVSPLVCRLLQKELDHDEMWYQSQLESFKSLAKQYLPKS
ncbi:MAG: glycerol-3-phosphate dehydrogenase/oxidase [Saprospiraceae bacterium]|nr:glycerol-3-phosphate dehydrogenase/oxidase [Saprospiraceae bacterium]